MSAGSADDPDGPDSPHSLDRLDGPDGPVEEAVDELGSLPFLSRAQMEGLSSILAPAKMGFKVTPGSRCDGYAISV